MKASGHRDMTMRHGSGDQRTAAGAGLLRWACCAALGSMPVIGVATTLPHAVDGNGSEIG